MGTGGERVPGAENWLVLPLGAVRAPEALVRAERRLPGLHTRSPQFDDYVDRQARRLEEHCARGGDIDTFRAEEWPYVTRPDGGV